MTPHGSDPDAKPINGSSSCSKVSTPSENLVGLGTSLPLFPADPMAQVLVDPGYQAAAQRNTEVRGLLCAERMLPGQHLAVNFQNWRMRVVQQLTNLGVQRTKLREQFPHVLGTPARRGLVGHAGHPLHQTGLVQRPHTHQHTTHGAVATDPVPPSLDERLLDYRHIHRVKNNYGVTLHTQGGSGVDPVPGPAGRAQLREHFCRVVTALGSDDDVALLQGGDVHRILEPGFILCG